MLGISGLAVFLLFVEFLVIYFFSHQFLRGFLEAYRTENYLHSIATVQENLKDNAKTVDATLLSGADVESLKKSIEIRHQKIDQDLTSLRQTFETDPDLVGEFDHLLELRIQIEDIDAKLFALFPKGKAKTYSLALEQFRLEQMESLSKIAIALRSRLDLTFDNLFNSKNQPIIAGLVFALLAGVLFCLLAFKLAHRINRSLHNLEESAERAGSGDLEAKAEILYHDEIGKLTDSFNLMTRNLKEITVSKKLLEEKNQELEQFSYVASHDLQEPLRKISAYGDVLMEDYADKLDEEGREDIHIMQDAAYRMQELIESLLAYSRIGRSEEPFIKISLSELIKEICGDLEVTIKESKAVIEFESLPEIYGDPVQMRQLFQNLIGNAIKFTKKGVVPHIKIESQMVNGKLVEIHVIDNGIGFESKYVERIFLPFRRLVGREEYKGTGIGLAICKKIVERHGGHITAESRVGQGTEFVIQLTRG